MRVKPDFPKLKIINNARLSYFNEELNLITKRLNDEYKNTEDRREDKLNQIFK
jgi:hypothetical protein